MDELAEKLEREGFKIASLSKRIIAMTIDDLLVSLIVVIAFSPSFERVRTFQDALILTDRLFVYIFIAYTLYHWLFVAFYGKTIGKFITKIKVIDIKTFDKPNIWFSFIRSLMRNFDEMFFYMGMAVAIFDKYNRALHDIVGRCVVVED